MTLWPWPSLRPCTAKRCSADEHGGKMVDGVTEGEVRSETG
jgi:hypothetical protein